MAPLSLTSQAWLLSALFRDSSPDRQGVGSGFILDAEGRIVTNNHVVQDASQLAVTFQDKTTVPGKLIGRDPDNDLAVIQVDASAKDTQGNPISPRIPRSRWPTQTR